MRTYESLLGELAQIDPRVVVLTAENRSAIRNLPAILGDRFVDVGIAEQTLVGMSAGLALRGRVPVAHSLATFLTMRAFEFIRTDVGIPGLPVKLVGSVPGFLSEANGPTHQALEDVALMRGIPGMRVFAPADDEDLLLGLPRVLADPAPWYVRFNVRRAVVSHAAFHLGRAEVVSEGRDVAILTYGVLFEQAVEAARLLTEDGVSVTLLNMRTLEPFDDEAVLEAARSTGFLVTLEDHFERGGLYAIVCELLVRRRLSPVVVPFALSARWFAPGLFDDVLRAEGFRGDQIAGRVRRCLSVRAGRKP
jgi:transketolase